MVELKKNECTGCGVCAKKCPQKCIKMVRNKEGFLIPTIDKDKCMNCGLCKKVCPFINYDKYIHKKELNKVFLVQIKDKEILKKCASGGAFAGIAKQVLKDGGVVVGASECDLNDLHFEIIDKEEDLCKVLGSKYYQCDLTQELLEEIDNIAKEKIVFFGGTPCQVAALKEITINKENILTADIICQGVPSQKCIKNFREYKQKNSRKKITKHYFRSKDRYLYRDYLAKYEFSDGSVEYIEGDKDLLCSSFQRQIFLRESCYNCKFATEERVGDITLGDIWEIEKNFDDINEKKGMSILICNTDKGCRYLENSIFFNKHEIDKKNSINNNIPFHHPVKRPICRNISYKLLNLIGPKNTLNMCCPKYAIKTLIRKLGGK